MPAIREQLIELLTDGIPQKERLPFYAPARRIADHMVSNGVTVQQWIPVGERLPEFQEEVLTYSDCVGVRAGSLIAANGADHPAAWYLCRLGKISIAVTHWMPLPEPPVADMKPDDPCETCLRWPECNGVDDTCPLRSDGRRSQ